MGHILNYGVEVQHYHWSATLFSPKIKYLCHLAALCFCAKVRRVKSNHPIPALISVDPTWSLSHALAFNNFISFALQETRPGSRVVCFSLVFFLLSLYILYIVEIKAIHTHVICRKKSIFQNIVRERLASLQTTAHINRMQSDKEITVKKIYCLISQAQNFSFPFGLLFLIEKDNERGSSKPHFHWCSNTQLPDLRTGEDQREWFSFW